MHFECFDYYKGSTKRGAGDAVRLVTCLGWVATGSFTAASDTQGLRYSTCGLSLSAMPGLGHVYIRLIPLTVIILTLSDPERNYCRIWLSISGT